MKNQLLAQYRYLVANCDNPSKRSAAYYAAKLLNQFGVVVDKPSALTKAHVQVIANLFGVNIPDSFYKNPQDTQYFTCEELLIEQLVSYFMIEHVTGVFSMDANTFKRYPIFTKALPDYHDGEEIKLRNFTIIDDTQAEEKLMLMAHDLSVYTRPWASDEKIEFKWLYTSGYYCGEQLNCKDNAIYMLIESGNECFARLLDQKDVVKLSILLTGGELPNFSYTAEAEKILNVAVNNAHTCPLSKKQSKYYNTVLKKIGSSQPRTTNSNSPYAIAKKLIANGQVVEAAKVFAKNGSLLNRNIVWLLSRANRQQAEQILDLMKFDNPIAMIQLVQGITNSCDSDGKYDYRVFTFPRNGRLKRHTETDYEHIFRKSVLSTEMHQLLRDILLKQIKRYYEGKKLGKIYINPQFKKIAPPLNTSTNGKGLDVLPSGSRLPLSAQYVRAFCYWHNAFDIDASVIFVRPNGETQKLYWGSTSLKPFGNSALTSGDCRDKDGAEYIDFRVSELKDLGFQYAIFTITGYASDLNSGEIYCGYQNKKNLNTTAWSAKNIELKIHVKGETRNYIGFALDLYTNEVVILNSLLNSACRVVKDEDYISQKKYLKKSYLETLNMWDILNCCGELTDNPQSADVVFDSEYTAKDNQTVIRPFEIEKLVALLK